MNLDHNFVQVSKLSEDQKKGSSPKLDNFFPQIQVQTKKRKKKGRHRKWNTFFPNSSGHLRSDAHQRQSIGEDADVDHTQIIRGDTVKLLGVCISPGFRHPCQFGKPSFSATYISNQNHYSTFFFHPKTQRFK